MPFKVARPAVEIVFLCTGWQRRLAVYILLKNHSHALHGRINCRSSSIDSVARRRYPRGHGTGYFPIRDVVPSRQTLPRTKTLRDEIYLRQNLTTLLRIYEVQTHFSSYRSKNYVGHRQTILVVVQMVEDVTHIRIVMAIERSEQCVKGTVGAALTVDEIRLIY